MELNRCTGSRRAAARAALKRRPMPPTAIKMPGCVVRYLRRGLLLHTSSILTTLNIEVIAEPSDPVLLRRELARLDETRALLDIIGLANAVYERDVELDISLWPRLILNALCSQHQKEVERLQDAAADGIELPARDVPALGVVVAEVRNAIDLSPHRPMLRRARTRRRSAD